MQRRRGRWWGETTAIFLILKMINWVSKSIAKVNWWRMSSRRVRAFPTTYLSIYLIIVCYYCKRKHETDNRLTDKKMRISCLMTAQFMTARSIRINAINWVEIRSVGRCWRVWVNLLGFKSCRLRVLRRRRDIYSVWIVVKKYVPGLSSTTSLRQFLPS